MNSVQEYASSLSNEIKWHGNNDQSSKSLVLKAGLLSMICESGNLRYISIGNHKVLLMIYPAVRDKKWLTVIPVISGEEFDIHEDWFRIKYFCRYKSGEIDFSAQYAIEGNKDNSLIFSLEGEAMNSFEKNRIGFCVLHPAEDYAGKSCIIGHTNGESETLIFPRRISPDQPFNDIQSMRWKIADNNCNLVFHGDIFETEDQRNWTDASYKTYCTPVNKPFPVRIEKGSRMTQMVEFKVEIEVEAEAEVKVEKSRSRSVIITVYPEKMLRLPAIGIGQTSRPESLTDEEIHILNKLHFDHYRSDLFLFRSDWKKKAGLAACEASGIGCHLELVLFFDDNFANQIAELIAWNAFIKPSIAMMTVFHKSHPSTPDYFIDKLVPLLREAFPRVKIGSGTNANFAQLNRARTNSPLLDYISYSIHPQEHASDNTTLIENLQAQSYTVESAMYFANGRKIWISPVNIQRRFNANIENWEQISMGVDCPPQVDSRLMSIFGACWTAGSLKYLCESGTKGVTYFETVGERGIFQGDHPSRWPERFQSLKGMIFPVYHVFSYILKNKSYKIVRSHSSNPLKVECLLMSDGKHIKLILVNFTSNQQEVIFKDGFKGSEFKIRQLNAETYSNAVSNINWIESARQTIIHPNELLLLRPFSVSFVESEY